jgi:high mobility group protein B1
MENYEPPKGESGGKKATAKEKKDPNAPKRGMSSFMYFSNEVRAKLKTENPGMSFGELVSNVARKLEGRLTANPLSNR